jgi:hypothetical protein
VFHFQSSVRDWPFAVEKLPNKSLIKVIDRGDILRDVKAINPNITTVLRHYGFHEDLDTIRTLEQHKDVARSFFSTFIDGTFLEKYAAYTDIVLEFNEYLASSHGGDDLLNRIRWAEAVSYVWKHEYQVLPEINRNGNPIRLGLLSCPVGNDIHRDFAEIALEYDAVLSYHAYDKFLSDHERDPQSFRYHCGRWHYMEQEWGLKPDWMFGESGPYHGVLEGWRHSKVLSGDTNAYIEAVRRWISEMSQTPAYQEGRILGFNLFTTGGTSEWKYYETQQPEMGYLANMINQEWNPGEEPMPEPRRYKKVAHLVRQDITRKEYDRIMDEAFPNKNSVFFSADDWALTLVSDLVEITARELIVWDVDKILNLPEEEAKSALEEWINTYYPNPKPAIIYRKAAELDFF